MVQEKANLKVSICNNFPDIKINYFYEDRIHDQEYPIAGDAFIIEDEMPDDFIICVDGMRRTVDFYKKTLNRNYRISSRFYHGKIFVSVDA